MTPSPASQRCSTVRLRSNGASRPVPGTASTTFASAVWTLTGCVRRSLRRLGRVLYRRGNGGGEPSAPARSRARRDIRIAARHARRLRRGRAAGRRSGRRPAVHSGDGTGHQRPRRRRGDSRDRARDRTAEQAVRRPASLDGHGFPDADTRPADAETGRRTQDCYARGYYDWPRGSSAEELAATLDISAPTLHYRLRKAHDAVIGSLFDSDTGSEKLD